MPDCGPCRPPEHGGQPGVGLGSNLSIVQNRQDFTNNMVTTLKTGADGSPSPTPTWKAPICWLCRPGSNWSITALSLASQANQSGF